MHLFDGFHHLDFSNYTAWVNSPFLLHFRSLYLQINSQKPKNLNDQFYDSNYWPYQCLKILWIKARYKVSYMLIDLWVCFGLGIFLFVCLFWLDVEGFVCLFSFIFVPLETYYQNNYVRKGLIKPNVEPKISSMNTTIKGRMLFLFFQEELHA